MKLKMLVTRPRSLWLRIPLWIVAVWLFIVVARFVVDLVRPYHPKSLAEVPFLDHAESRTSGPVRVTAAALAPDESNAIFGVPLALEGIQPVWLEVQNEDTVPLFYLRAGTDPAWFSPYEAYWLNRLRAPRRANRRMRERFYELTFSNPVPPGETRSGFVFTRLDEGVKVLDLDLVGIAKVNHNFSLRLLVPGFRGDYQALDFGTMYHPDSLIEVETEDALRRALEKLPCCTANRAGDRAGDPLNVVLVGHRDHAFPALARRGWSPTEQTYVRAIWRTIRSFVLRSRYLYSPVSPLYVFGRPQDIAAQKARATVHLRNHARFWMTPIRFRGAPVWIGQISRDVGVRFILAIPPTTHKIDPDVDEARNGLIQDLAYSQALARFAYVSGVGAAPREAPRHNLTGDPYFTDGLRAVLFLEARPLTLTDVQFLEWERTEQLVPSEKPRKSTVAPDSVRGESGR